MGAPLALPFTASRGAAWQQWLAAVALQQLLLKGQFPKPTGVRQSALLSSAPLAPPAAMCSQFKGKVLLIVNVASQCGFTPQYKVME